MIIGHHKQLQFLKNMVEMGQLPHALLFSGEDQLGKRTIAFELAKFLNCQAASKPCQECRICKDIERGIYPDLFFIEPQGKDIQISQIRNLKSRLALKPAHGFWKVGIIDTAQQMTREAQQAFLKTLEEPRGNTIIFLISSHPELLLSVCRSRAQQVKFFSLTQEELIKELIKKGAKQESAENIAKISWGRPGRAIELWLNPQKVQEYGRRKKEFLALWQSGLPQRFQYAKKIADGPANLPEFIELWVHLSRDKLKDALLGKTEFNKFSYIKTIKNLQNLSLLISQSNINPRLALELAFLELRG